MKEELRCPFCGGKVHIVICDDECNIKDKEYEKDPWSGLGYGLIHKDEDALGEDICPITTQENFLIGERTYATREEAIETWNKKK